MIRHREKKLLLIVALVTALLAIFIVVQKPSNHPKFAVSLLASADLSKDISSLHEGTSSVDNSFQGPTSTPPTLADVLEELQDQYRSVASQIVDLRSQIKSVNSGLFFVRDMQLGDSGEDVSRLQKLLEKRGLYHTDTKSSNRVTGYYGYLTKRAVTEFQAQTGVEQTGVADQETRDKLYESADETGGAMDTSTSTNLVDISTVTDLQNISLQQDMISRLSSSVADASTSIMDVKNQIAQIFSSLSNIQTSIDTLTTSMANQNSGPSAPIPASPTPSPSATSSSAPFTISSVQATSTTKTSSTVSWATNNPSTSQVSYSLHPDLSLNKTASSTAMVTTHSLMITSLNSGTKYYYRVISKDNSGTTAMSDILSFNTLP